MMFKNVNLDLDNLKILLKKIALFHGHYCPGIAYGLRASILGLSKIKAGKDCELNIFSGTSSCPLDAVQIVTGCTIGNGKLQLENQGNHEFAFWNRSQNRGVLVELKKVIYHDSPDEIEAIKLNENGDNSRETLKIIDSRLNNKIDRILTSKEEEVLKITRL